MPDPQRLRVLSIAHTAVSREAGRLRYHPLAHDPSLDVHLIVPRRWHQFGRWMTADPGPDPGVTLHVMPIVLPRAGRARWYLHAYPGLGRLVRHLRPDVLHFWEEPWSVVAAQGAWLAQRYRAGLVLEVDQNILKRLPTPFEQIRRSVLRQTSVVLARSDEAEAVVRACGYTGPVQAISYGVNRDVFRPTARPPHPSLRLGYVGRIVEEKGLDDVLDALAATPHAELAIMGEGPQQQALEARIVAEGLAGRVRFEGWGPPAAVARFIGGLDALVLMTRTTQAVREQFGRVILEAQSCGVPVIGSTSGAIPSVLGTGGWVVPERDGAALATLLRSLTPTAINARGAAGIANVEARFTYEVVAHSLAHAWRMARPRSPP